MKYLTFLSFLILLSGCESNFNKVYWCGDHSCVNKKEKEAYFEKTMIVEVRELTEANKLSKSEKNKIIKQIRAEKKKNYKEMKKLAKQKLKKEKNLKKEMRKKSKIKNDYNKNKQEISELQSIDEPILLFKEESNSSFTELVEKIKINNLKKPYPNINNLPK